MKLLWRASRLTAARISLIYALFASLWILGSGYFLTLTVTDQVLGDRIEIIKGLMYVAVSSILLYLLLKVWHGPESTPVPVDHHRNRRHAFILLILLALILSIPAGGLLLFRFQHPGMRHPDIESQLVNMLFWYGIIALCTFFAAGAAFLMYWRRYLLPLEPPIKDKTVLKRLRTDITHAIAHHDLVLHYQPRIELGSGRVCGLDALMRWNHPQRGLLAPAEFLPFMEESALMLETDQWALEQATRDYRYWRESFAGIPRIAVNISAMALRNIDMVNTMLAATSRSGELAPIDIKISERLLETDFEQTIEKFQAIRNAGLRIIIDDFGAGSFPLSYLSRLPADALKIDRGFISTMTEQPESMTVISSIIALAHALNLQVIAGGVETEEQVKYLRLLRCDEMLGYLYSRPVPASEVLGLLTNGINGI